MYEKRLSGKKLTSSLSFFMKQTQMKFDNNLLDGLVYSNLLL